MVHHAGTAEDGSKGIRLEYFRAMLPMDEVAADGMGPSHIVPHRAVRSPLVVKVPFPVKVEHTVGIVHPGIFGGMVKCRTEFFPVRLVETVGKANLAPAYFVLDFPAVGTVHGHTGKQFHLPSPPLVKAERHIVVHFVQSQAQIQSPHLVIAANHPHAGLRSLFLNWKKEEL